MDVVVSNQVFEHLKKCAAESEVVPRAQARGMAWVLSVPQPRQPPQPRAAGMASAHFDRTLGPHVRGYTFGEIQQFVALDGLRVVQACGAASIPSRSRSRIGWRACGRVPAYHRPAARKQRETAEPPWVAWYRKEREAGLQSCFE